MVYVRKGDTLIFAILKKHGVSYEGDRDLLKIKPTRKRWTEKEKENAYQDWAEGMPFFDLVCKYNRNPKDLSQVIRAKCKDYGTTFKQTQKPEIDNKTNWNADCAQELFEAGLPLWKVAIALECEMDYVQNHLINRGHDKKINQISTDHKWFVNEKVLSESPKIKRALEAFGGYGHSAEIIKKTHPEAHVDVVEIDKETLDKGRERCPQAEWFHMDSADYIKTTTHKYDFVDLDPFSNSYDHLQNIWGLLEKEGVFFLTFGGEYFNGPLHRNRLSIERRYGFRADDLEYSDYRRELPFAFLGWVFKQANDNGYALNLMRAVRYMSICRFWFTFKQDPNAIQYEPYEYGLRPNFEVSLPKFKEVRSEMISDDVQGTLF